MFHKHHFYSLLALLAVLGIYALNYFDGTYMKFVLINLFVSCVLDLGWMIVLANVLYMIYIGILVYKAINSAFYLTFWLFKVHRDVCAHHNNIEDDFTCYIVQVPQ